MDVIVNNEYQGIYVLTERIKQDKNRVDIAKLTTEDNSGPELTGGYIFKIDYYNSNNSWQSPYSPPGHPDFNVHFVYHDPDEKELTSAQKTYIKEYVTEFESVLNSTNYNNLYDGYYNYIDLQSFIDYFIVSEISRNNDGFKKSRYFFKDKNGKINAGPVWDFDWAWKNINECFIFKATDGSGWSYKVNDCFPDINSPDWMITLFDDFSFKRRANCRYFELRENELSDEIIFGIVDSLYNVVKNAQVKHFEKWPILGQNAGAPEIDALPGTFEGEVEKLKNWISLRLNWLDTNMIGDCDGEIPIELISDQKHLVYPNPASTKLNILSKETIAEFRLYDLTGRVVFSRPAVYKKSQEIDVTLLPPGIYIIKLKDAGGKTFTEKVIVQ